MKGYINDFECTDVLWRSFCGEMAVDKLEDSAKQLLEFEQLYNRIMDDEQIEYIRKVYHSVYKMSHTGRRSYDPAFMFKICVLQQKIGCTDEQMAGLLHHELLLYKIFHIWRDYKLPARRTISKYHDRFRSLSLDDYFLKLVEKNTIDEAHTGVAVALDSSFLEAPKQHNTREENEMIKSGRGDELWQDDINKQSHKDIDASWTKKRNQSYYGYKMHVKVDEDTKFIIKHTLTTAKTADNSQIEALLDQSDYGKICHADSGYVCAENPDEENILQKLTRELKINFQICERPGGKDKTFTDEQKLYNLSISPYRCRVEHVFGYMENCMGGMKIRTIGKEKARYRCKLMVAVYNMCRFIQILKYHEELLIDADKFQDLRNQVIEISGIPCQYESYYVYSRENFRGQYIEQETALPSVS